MNSPRAPRKAVYGLNPIGAMNLNTSTTPTTDYQCPYPDTPKSISNQFDLKLNKSAHDFLVATALLYKVVSLTRSMAYRRAARSRSRTKTLGARETEYLSFYDDSESEEPKGAIISDLASAAADAAHNSSPATAVHQQVSNYYCSVCWRDVKGEQGYFSHRKSPNHLAKYIYWTDKQAAGNKLWKDCLEEGRAWARDLAPLTTTGPASLPQRRQASASSAARPANRAITASTSTEVRGRTASTEAAASTEASLAHDNLLLQMWRATLRELS